jgi:hypothetical protein
MNDAILYSKNDKDDKPPPKGFEKFFKKKEGQGKEASKDEKDEKADEKK